MLAVRCGPEGLRLRDVDPPTGEGRRVFVTHIGICGSDVDLVASGAPREVTLGHEIAGVLGDGTPVAIEPLLPCGDCAPCRTGAYNLCEFDRWLGGSIDGGMTQEIVVPQRCLVPVPDAVALEDACLVEPLAVALHGLRRAQIQAGEKVVILGAGTIGLLATAVALAHGCDVTVLSRYRHQRELAERIGAHVAEDATGQDLAVAAAGGSDGIATASRMARPGGRLLVLTVPRGPFAPLETAFREVTVVPSLAYAGTGPRDIDDAMALLASTPVLTDLITHRFPLARVHEAFATAADRRSGAIKVVVETGIN